MDVRSVVVKAMARGGVSQRELAARAEVDRARVNRWINGRGTITVESLERIMAVLRLVIVDEGRGA